MLVRNGKEGLKGEMSVSEARQFSSAGTVESAFFIAANYTSQKLGMDSKAVIALLKDGDQQAFSYCNYSIAKQLGETLGKLDTNIKAAYLLDYDAATVNDIGYGVDLPVTLIRLIILAERKTNAVEALMESLDTALTARYANVLGLNLQHVLDVQVIDEADVKNCTGFGALINSINKPIKVWNS